MTPLSRAPTVACLHLTSFGSLLSPSSTERRYRLSEEQIFRKEGPSAIPLFKAERDEF